jgi:predicted  nucleic acid-binding Zn-ribbon protein
VAVILQLYQLQSLDSEIDHVNQQLAEIAAQLGESDELKQTRAAQQTAAVRLRKAQTLMQDLELELKSLSNKISGQEKLLYSGRVLSAKEAANLQDEVASLKRWHSEREEKLLEAMVDVEAVEAELADAEANLSTVEAGWNADQSDLVKKQAELKSSLANLQKRRPTAIAGIDATSLETYEKLRKKKAGRAVAAVKSGICQGCGMTPSNNKIRQARAGTEILYCSACGRVLYVP